MTDYYELAALADRAFAISDDDVEALAGVLDSFEENLRFELLFSDFFNAFQVFYYFFREMPTELGEERLILHPAGDCAKGVLVEDQGIFSLSFQLSGKTPVILVKEGEEVVRTFTGTSAYHDAVAFADEYG
ncbi:MAG: hypothetical protein RQ758_09005 [Methanomicrobiaceae archaeon]|nr:hypothetical protein [Methanomicrobiaceae archaeon]